MFNNFAADTKNLPIAFRSALYEIVRVRTEAQALALVNQAVEPFAGGTNAIRREGVAFASAEPVLSSIKGRATNLGAEALLARVNELTESQVLRIINAADAAIVQRGPYKIQSGFSSSWGGEVGGAPRLFGFASEASLAGANFLEEAHQ